jgi:EAL domain-containing protein (putative c-di-GMP-specific phosphodiesterase class I)/GGDEF domain-containing protein/ABC-type amino acid transport substrate-binding protein
MFICLIGLLTCPPRAFADDAREPLVVGVPVDRCPIFYRDADTGEVEGIGIDLMRAAAEEAGYDATFVVVEEDTLKDALDNDAYDVVMPFGSAIDSSSGHATIVSDNLMETPFTLVTMGNRTLPPLGDLKVGMLSSLAGGAETIQQLYPHMQIVFYETMDESVAALRSGEVDALLHNSYVWSHVLQKPAYAKLTVQPSAVFSMDFRAGTLDTPAGRALIERLDEGIAKIDDTRRQAIVLDYTSRRTYRYDLSDYLYQYGLVLLLVVLLFVLLLVNGMQRRRVLVAEQERRMRELIDRDPLTGALSLDGFRKRVTELLRDNPDTPYLLSYANIRNFKYINNSLGRAAGDDLLRIHVDASKKVLTDKEAIGRIEADHFAVLRCSAGEEGMLQDEQAVFEPLRNYFVERGGDNRVQVCGGVYVLTPEDYQHIDVDRMLDYARVAEGRVRASRKDGYEFYNPEQWEKDKQAAEVTSHLASAIQAGELAVWYQPQVDGKTGAIIGAEALCRWNHGKLGWLSPSEFIPALEEAGLIYDLDRFVWERACEDLRRWNEMGMHRSVSVNMSRSDIRDQHDVAGHFRQLIEKYGLTPDQLSVEITETAYVEDSALLIDTTTKLQQLGFRVEMDDFGSGFSSLHMLKEVPVDRIKLDLHFLSDSGDVQKGRIIVSQIIQMIHALGMSLIAEGVETAEQASFLLEQGCTEMQGYFYHKPMPVEEFERLL